MTLVTVVFLHLAVSLAHGSAHAAAEVRESPAALVFVFAVILAGPLLGLVWMRVDPASGALLIAATMAGGLLFGLVNHFLVPGADRVDSVGDPVRLWFGTTAVLLVITEAAGAALGLRYARHARRRLA